RLAQPIRGGRSHRPSSIRRGHPHFARRRLGPLPPDGSLCHALPRLPHEQLRRQRLPTRPLPRHRGSLMSATPPPPAHPDRQPLPRNVKVLGLVSLLNDVGSETIYPLLPGFLLGVLRGSLFYLGVIEGAAESVGSLLKLWSGGRSDQAGRRKGFVLLGYSLAALARPLAGVVAPWQ